MPLAQSAVISGSGFVLTDGSKQAGRDKSTQELSALFQFVLCCRRILRRKVEPIRRARVAFVASGGGESFEPD